MRTIPVWVYKVQDVNKIEQWYVYMCLIPCLKQIKYFEIIELDFFLNSIYDLCFNPDGSQLVVAAGQIVIVYSSIDGSVIRTLKGKFNY